MQKLVYFVVGLMVGALTSIAILCVISNDEISKEDNPTETIEETFEQKLSMIEGVTLLTESNAKIRTTSNKIKIFQSLAPGYALANIQTGKYEYETLIVFLADRNGQPFYDDQEIVIPKGCYIKQIGTYKYETKLKFDKTVPIVEIINNTPSTTN